MASRSTLIIKKDNKFYPIYIHDSANNAIYEHIVNLALANTYSQDELEPLHIIKYGRLLKCQWKACCSIYQSKEELCIDEGCFYLNLDNKTYFSYDTKLTTELYHAKDELAKFKHMTPEQLKTIQSQFNKHHYE